MSIQLRGLAPPVRERAELALTWAQKFGIRPFVTSGFRSWSEQLELRRKWEAGLSPWPANLPGDSAHNFGWAWDSTISDPRYTQDSLNSWWIAVRRAAGFNVPSNDRIHAEVPNWRQFRP